MFGRLTELLDGYLAMGIPGYDCIVYHKGECVYRHWNGYSDLENKISMNGKERYNIYSCSKPVTCAAALQLYEKGLYSLEDKLSDYMPEFAEMTVRTPDGLKQAENPIRIKHLFEMTAGFSYDLFTPELERGRRETEGRYPTREMARCLAKEPLLFEPGARWEYSLCHDVLAAFVEVISGVRFGDYVKANIFAPLGMSRSTYLLPDDELDTIAAQYRYKRETGERRNIGPRCRHRTGSEYESGGGGCISTVEDYIKFLEAMRIGDVILKRDTIRLMAADRLNGTQKASYPVKNYSYGLGVRCPANGSERTDFGWDGAAGAYLAIDIENQITVFYAQHMLQSPVQTIHHQVYDVVREELM